MSLSEQSEWRHANQYSADSACAHCEGIVSHESWCSSKNARVRYAFQAALHPDQRRQNKLLLIKLGAGEAQLLHAELQGRAV